METKIKIRAAGLAVPWVVAAALLLSGALVAAVAQAPARFLGTVTAISGNTLTVKTDAGDSRQVDVPSTASLKQIEPGAKDLSTAVTIEFSSLAAGDRVLVRPDANAPAGITQALQIIAIKKEDLAQKQQREREDWQKNGVGGLVKSVDNAGGVIVLTSGAGTTAKTITVHTSPATVLKRYVPGSVSFDQAQPAPINAIQPGDQLRARGSKNADGTEIAAAEVVSGSFRNISGTITSIDTASSTLAVKDLATKKQVTIHIAEDAQMRRLPDRMATMLAARLKGGAGAGGSGGFQRAGQSENGGGGVQGGGRQGMGQAGGAGGPGGSAGGFDPQQMLNRAPVIKLADLQKGEAIMVVSTQGTTDVTAITLVAGVEPLLEAPAASNLLSNWSMGGDSPEASQ